SSRPTCLPIGHDPPLTATSLPRFSPCWHSRLKSKLGTTLVWVFNVWGCADLLYAFYQANRVGLEAGQLGAAYFIVTVFVPLLLITHGLLFRLLLQGDVIAAEPCHRRASLEEIETVQMRTEPPVDGARAGTEAVREFSLFCRFSTQLALS